MPMTRPPATIIAAGTLTKATPATMSAPPTTKSPNSQARRTLAKDGDPMLLIDRTPFRAPHLRLNRPHDAHDTIVLALTRRLVRLLVSRRVHLHRHIIRHPRQHRVATVVQLPRQEPPLELHHRRGEGHMPHPHREHPVRAQLVGKLHPQRSEER